MATRTTRTIRHQESKPKPKYVRGDIYYIHDEQNSDGTVKYKPIGDETWSNRYAVIISNNLCNENSGCVTVAYITTNISRYMPTHVQIISDSKHATVLCEATMTISKKRLGSKLAKVTPAELQMINSALLIAQDIPSSAKATYMFNKWEQYIKELNLTEDFNQIKVLGQYIETGKQEDLDLGLGLDLNTVIPDIGILNPETPTVDISDYLKIKAERDAYKTLYDEQIKRSVQKV